MTGSPSARDEAERIVEDWFGPSADGGWPRLSQSSLVGDIEAALRRERAQGMGDAFEEAASEARAGIAFSPDESAQEMAEAIFRAIEHRARETEGTEA